MASIKEKIFGIRKPKSLDEKDIIKFHDILMTEYGWIPLEEFKELPIPTFWNLIQCIHDRKEAERKESEKAKRK